MTYNIWDRIHSQFRRRSSLMKYLVQRNREDDRRIKALMHSVLDHDSNCIDAGANVGSVLAQMVSLAPDGHHIAYEPLVDLCESLRRRFPTVDVRSRALSNVNSTSEFFHFVNDPGWSGFRQRDYPGTAVVELIQVPTRRLDDELPVDYVPTLIKIDVEGAEYLVLEGARETIARHRPVVFFEHGTESASLYGTTTLQLYEFIRDVGLKIYGLDGSGPYDPPEFETALEGNWNFVAHD